jgi:hypothetical protein
VACIKALPKRIKQRQRIATGVGPLVKFVKECPRKCFPTSLGSHGDACDRADIDPSPSKPDPNLEQEGVRQDPPTPLGDKQAIEAAEIVTREKPPPRLDAARIRKGTQMNLYQTIEIGPSCRSNR